jgi:hypothetical protein
MDIANVKPPVAEKRPRIETWHGHEKRDDYHWLKAANWQEVMHDPSLLPQDVAPLKARMLIIKQPRQTKGTAGRTVCRDEGPHQGG